MLLEVLVVLEEELVPFLASPCTPPLLHRHHNVWVFVHEAAAKASAADAALARRPLSFSLSFISLATVQALSASPRKARRT